MPTDDSPTSPVDLPPTTTPPAAAPGGSAAAPPPPPPTAGDHPVRTPAAAPVPRPGDATGSPGPGSSAWPAPHAPDAGANTPALVFGVLLVAAGGLLLVTRLTDIGLDGSAWPRWGVVPGLALLVASFAVPPRGGLGLAIPGAIVTTVGLVLWVQDTYDAYATWAYAWALVAPTAPGVGMLLYGLVRGDGELVRDGLRTTLVGLALFAGFALFFEGVVGLSGQPIAQLEDVLPYAAIGLGVLLVVASIAGGGRRGRTAR
jgi:hypothetical protein